jgi:acyl-coenzyme A synthetase/AMP-(fatty) acid ligase
MILGDLLFLSADGSRTVARQGEKNISQDDFLGRLSGLYSALHKHSSQSWLLFSDDALDFSITLLALLCAGKKVVLAPNRQEGTLALLTAQCDAVFSATDIPDAADNKKLSGDFVIPATALISIASSGSSGAMKLIDKPLPSFIAELDNLEQHWGSRVEDAIFFSTVSHQHIYGLLFRVLWPLRRGCVFGAQSDVYPEPLFDAINRCAGKSRAVLVSSPAHLTRIPEAIDGRLATQTLVAVFSSGGPLPAEAAVDFTTRFGVCPLEIFGSTETGGIAWRQQKSTTAATWHTFADVETRIDEDSACLAIRSPYCYQGNWFVMGDRVELLDGHRFIHHGRADRIVKLEEKRLSLSAMEQLLLTHPWVEEAKIILLAVEGRQTLAAVLVLNLDGAAQLKNGKRLLNEIFKNHLLQCFERVLLPRKWRYVSALPCNSQGKIVQQDLQDLFV